MNPALPNVTKPPILGPGEALAQGFSLMSAPRFAANASPLRCPPILTCDRWDGGDGLD